MDRGIPTEDVLEEMRAADPPVRYLVGTPKGRLSAGEELAKPWQEARPGVEVKLLPQDGELYVFAQSATASPKSAACAGASSRDSGAGSLSPRRSSPPTSCS